MKRSTVAALVAAMSLGTTTALAGAASATAASTTSAVGPSSVGHLSSADLSGAQLAAARNSMMRTLRAQGVAESTIQAALGSSRGQGLLLRGSGPLGAEGAQGALPAGPKGAAAKAAIRAAIAAIRKVGSRAWNAAVSKAPLPASVKKYLQYEAIVKILNIALNFEGYLEDNIQKALESMGVWSWVAGPIARAIVFFVF